MTCSDHDRRPRDYFCSSLALRNCGMNSAACGPAPRQWCPASGFVLLCVMLRIRSVWEELCRRAAPPISRQAPPRSREQRTREQRCSSSFSRQAPPPLGSSAARCQRSRRSIHSAGCTSCEHAHRSQADAQAAGAGTAEQRRRRTVATSSDSRSQRPNRQGVLHAQQNK